MSTDKTEQIQYVTLQSSDGKEFRVNLAVASVSLVIKNLLTDLGLSNQVIPIANIRGHVIEWCEHHVNEGQIIISEWDERYIEVEHDLLLDITLAANYLEIKSLLDLGCKKVANMIRDKSPEEIRASFNIEKDFTPEEEELVRIENGWIEGL
ncbi:1817_t:CDS:2 [Ambispora leptoticha]|uniref:E3 ubiquitin ligase complex SCF subunit n=1 Tax=Ambispora leptoticha TaxID=144679 RepID=A0A9N8VR70_9GLOM|nr:1817_t:CDS:2 [Ambispora leptoticha]